MMTQIELNAARSVVSISQSLSKISETLTYIAKQMAEQNESLKKLLDKPPVSEGWYFSKPAK